jgi:hypothetical protein
MGQAKIKSGGPNGRYTVEYDTGLELLEQRKKAYEDAIAALQPDLEDVEGELAAKEQALREAKAASDAAIEELEEVLEARRNPSVTPDDIDDLAHDAAVKQGEINDKQDYLAFVEGEIEGASSAAASQTSYLNNLANQKLEITETEITPREDRMVEISERIALLEELLAADPPPDEPTTEEFEQEIEDLMIEQNQIAIALIPHYADIADIDLEMENLGASIASLEAYVTSMEGARATTEAEIEYKIEQLEAMNNQLQEMRDEYMKQTSKEVLDEAINKAKDLVTKAVEAGAEVDKWKFLREPILRSIKTAEDEITRLEGLRESVVVEREVWCVDLTEDAEADSLVATVEIPGEPTAMLLAAGCREASSTDGRLLARALMTPAQAFWNAAVLPGWQRWMPTFRKATVTAVKKPQGAVDVLLDDAVSTAQSLTVMRKEASRALANVPVVYMDCGAEIFEVNDRVVIEFYNRDWDSPVCIGFVENPRECTPEYFYLEIQREYVEESYEFFPGNNLAVAKVGDCWQGSIGNSLGQNAFTGYFKHTISAPYVMGGSVSGLSGAFQMYRKDIDANKGQMNSEHFYHAAGVLWIAKTTNVIKDANFTGLVRPAQSAGVAGPAFESSFVINCAIPELGSVSGWVRPEYETPIYDLGTMYEDYFTPDNFGEFESWFLGSHGNAPNLTLTQGEDIFDLTFDGYGWKGPKVNAITEAQYAPDFTVRYIKRKRRPAGAEGGS